MFRSILALSLTAPCFALALLAGCVAPSQPLLDSANQRCLNGDQQACSMVPSLQAQVNTEHVNQQNQAVTAAAVAGGAALLTGAALAASHSYYGGWYGPYGPGVYGNPYHCWGCGL